MTPPPATATVTPTVTPTPTVTRTPTSTVVVTPIFPANYRATYTVVRDCRYSSEHGLVYIRVLANSVGAQPYLADANPLPVGSTIVKEEFSSADCNANSLLRWRVMRKEAAGFDPADGDWHWQWVNADRSVLLNDKSTCIGCHTVPACLARDHMCTVGAAPRGTLQLVLNRQPASLMSITGTSAADVYAVGADPGDGFGPYVLHYDGSAWQRLNTGVSGDLWWISVTPIDGEYYLAGANGVVLRYDPQANRFATFTTPGMETLFGIWGLSASDIWAVGGNPTDESGGGVLWHFDGITWSAVDLSGLLPAGVPTLYKVWGRGATDVYAIGRSGTMLHYDGATWAAVASNTTETLFTVHGNDTIVAATGGISNGLILEQQDGQFIDRAQPGTPQMNGVFVPPDGQAVAVGVTGALALRSDTGWTLADTGLATALDFHAAWVDPDGGIWAVGGDLSSLNNGMLAYGGTQTISSQVKAIVLCPPLPPNPSAVTTVSYAHDIVPLFTAAGCTAATCHTGPFPSNNYDLRAYATTFGPGLFAKSLKLCEIVPGNPDASFLVEKLGAAPRIGVRMPDARTPLTDAQINQVRTWILEGAYDDSPPTPTATKTASGHSGATPTRTPTPQPTPTAFTPGPTFTPNPACAQPGNICTVAGTGLQVFDGDGKPAQQTSLYFPLGVTFDDQGRALIVDWNNLRIRRIDSDGTIETLMGLSYEGTPVEGALAVDTPLHHASDIAFDLEGNLYVAGDHVPLVLRVGLDDRVSIVAGSATVGNAGDEGPAVQASLNIPFGVLPDAIGGFYVADVGANVIRYVDANGVIHRFAGTGTRGYGGDGQTALQAQLNGPTRLRFDPGGRVCFCDTNNHAVRCVDANGVIATIAGVGTSGYAGDHAPATQAHLATPYDLRFAPNGDLYIADTGNSVIRRVDSSGTITTVAGTGLPNFAGDAGAAGSCQLNRPSGVSFAADGSMWISDTFNNRVRRVAGFLGTVS